MKVRVFLVPAVCLGLLVFSAFSARSQTVVTFDDLPLNTSIGSFVPSSYQGLIWSNFGAVNAILLTATEGSNGYYNGMVSPSNVAFNAYANPAEIDSVTNFNFLSAYLTGAWNSNLNIEVQGFRSGVQLYDTTVVASATSPTLFTFGFTNVDRLHFNSFGGEDAGFPSGSDTHFVMDNFDFEFIPEPSTFLLAALGGLSLIAFLKRKRP
jgi:hypothetical protein